MENVADSKFDEAMRRALLQRPLLQKAYISQPICAQRCGQARDGGRRGPCLGSQRLQGPQGRPARPPL